MSNTLKEQKEDTFITKEDSKKIEQYATAHWEGNLKNGKGTLSTKTKVLNDTKYSFETRFSGDVAGTNPEELLAAAHAGCFTMSVASLLSKKELTASSLDTKAIVTMEGLNITAIHLSIAGTVDEITSEDFSKITEEAKNSCMISAILKIPVTLETTFVG